MTLPLLPKSVCYCALLLNGSIPNRDVIVEICILPGSFVYAERSAMLATPSYTCSAESKCTDENLALRVMMAIVSMLMGFGANRKALDRLTPRETNHVLISTLVRRRPTIRRGLVDIYVIPRLHNKANIKQTSYKRIQYTRARRVL